jgi:hypothetical protein
MAFLDLEPKGGLPMVIKLFSLGLHFKKSYSIILSSSGLMSKAI